MTDPKVPGAGSPIPLPHQTSVIPSAPAGLPDPIISGASPDPSVGTSTYSPARSPAPNHDAARVLLREVGMLDATGTHLEQWEMEQNRIDPKRLDGLTMPDGAVIRVFRDVSDFPDDPGVRRRWDNHYAVFEISNPRLGYVAYMGIHRLTQIESLTPILRGQWRATGGTRMRHYGEGALGALKDALELSSEMSFKSAGAGLGIGGSKCAVHVAEIDPSPLGSAQMARHDILVSYGRAIEEIGRRIGGGVLTGQDMNISETDAQLLFQSAPTSIVPYVAGSLSRPPTYPTAIGVQAALRVAMGVIWPERARDADTAFAHKPDLSNMVIAAQGVGGIGGLMLLPLLEAGAKVIASDIDANTIVRLFDNRLTEADSPLWRYIKQGQLHVFKEDRLPQSGYTSHIIDPLAAFPELGKKMGIDHIDIFAPFAVGGVLNDGTIPQLQRAGVKLVVGSANDMSADKRRHPQMLHEMGILYVPDYIANSGGLLVVDGHLGHEITDEAIFNKIAAIVRALLGRARAEGLPPQVVADREARSFFEALPRAPLPMPTAPILTRSRRGIGSLPIDQAQNLDSGSNEPGLATGSDDVTPKARTTIEVGGKALELGPRLVIHAGETTEGSAALNIVPIAEQVAPPRLVIVDHCPSQNDEDEPITITARGIDGRHARILTAAHFAGVPKSLLLRRGLSVIR